MGQIYLRRQTVWKQVTAVNLILFHKRILEKYLGGLPCYLHSNICPTGPPSKYQDFLAIKLLWLPVKMFFINLATEILQPVVVTVNQISFISVKTLDFWHHRNRVVAITNLG